MTSLRGPCLTWIVACMSGGIFKELVKMAPSVEVARVNGCLQVLRAPSVSGAEPSVVSPSGPELENGRRAGRRGVPRREDGKEWKMKMEVEILARV